MKQLRFVLVALAAAGLVHAQDEGRSTPPVEIPDFSNLDEYIHEPKGTVTLGFRRLDGAKTTFSGRGSIASPENPPDISGGPNLTRIYLDGSVGSDTRYPLFNAPADGSTTPATQQQDASGNFLFEAPPDGLTNRWNFIDASQVQGGSIAFHTYDAEILDSGRFETDSGSTNGLEIGMAHDMGTVFGTRLAWRITGGVSVNDISASAAGNVLANVRTGTDLFSLRGATPPGSDRIPFASSPSTLLVQDDSLILIENIPSGPRQFTTVQDSTSVFNRWKVKGSYFTFRLGPTLLIPITSKIKASISVGGALVYAGTNLTITETLDAPTGGDIVESETSDEHKVLPGYYADANIQYDLTEKAGFYAGAVFQSAGTYTQRLDNANSSYATKVDLSKQSGLRAGMSIRF